MLCIFSHLSFSTSRTRCCFVVVVFKTTTTAKASGPPLKVTSEKSCVVNLPLLFLSFSVHDKLPDPHCDGGTAGQGKNLHFKEAHPLPKLDRCAD